MLFDSHCHFDFPALQQAASQYLQDAKAHGVAAMLVPSVSREQWPQVMHCQTHLRDSSTNKPLDFYYALGLHPCFLEQHQDAADLAALDAALSIRSKHCVAVGECGLDWRLADQPIAEQSIKARQIQLLQGQLDLAKRHQLPVILHAVHCHAELLAQLKLAKLPQAGVIHGFTGSYEQAMAYIKLGFYIGVGGAITYPRALKTRRTVARLPLTSLLLETDAPDMPLHGFQGQVNTPAQIARVFLELCALRHESPEQISQTLWQNTLRCFQIEMH
ncbi:putative metal-dependent hydrolase YjjV [Vibrio stylophorae]|uniref:Metal-dependent hydrolase YjjV n=1 Tax=Vibrio stylophorae TaxID=659351 RepID=A0ABN8DVH5_9VIBR|nr:TatD family hydrolase [Vibrio stylophorae]CAH0532814.1 putative metal-dependent hydrolase YjjV [Vibrio stylophorae]